MKKSKQFQNKYIIGIASGLLLLSLNFSPAEAGILTTFQDNGVTPSSATFGVSFGRDPNSNNDYIAQSGFTFSQTGTIKSVDVQSLYKNGNPTDTIYAELYKGGSLPDNGTLVGRTATSSLSNYNGMPNGQWLTTSPQTLTLIFENDITIDSTSTAYSLVLKRTGPVSETNNYRLWTSQFSEKPGQIYWHKLYYAPYWSFDNSTSRDIGLVFKTQQHATVALSYPANLQNVSGDFASFNITINNNYDSYVNPTGVFVCYGTNQNAVATSSCYLNSDGTLKNSDAVSLDNWDDYTFAPMYANIQSNVNQQVLVPKKMGLLNASTTYYAKAYYLASAFATSSIKTPTASSPEIAFTIGSGNFIINNASMFGVPASTATSTSWNLNCDSGSWTDSICSVVGYLFVPSPGILDNFRGLTLANKFPFSYIYNVKEIILSQTSNSSNQYPSLTISTASSSIPMSVVLFNASTSRQYIGDSEFNIFYALTKGMVWLGLAYYIFARFRDLNLHAT